MTKTKKNNSRSLNAFCWRSGKLEYAVNVPDGAMLLMPAPTKALRDKIEVLCRLSKVNSDWYVPGVPEAQNDIEALAAVKRFIACVEYTLLPKEEREKTTWAQYVKDKTERMAG